MAKAPKSSDVFVIKPPLRERVHFVGRLGILVAATLVIVVINSIGGSNVFTPAGHEGYVFQQPLAIGQREFVRTQRGPTSTGWAWRYGVTNLDMRIHTYSEELKIFSSDNLEVTFEAH